MSFVCSESSDYKESESYNTGITREKELAKRSGTSPFSDYLGFQSNAKFMDEHVEKDDRDDEKKKRGSRSRTLRKGSKE